MNPDQLISALSDDRLRHILAAIAEEPLTVGEIAEECDLPRSTVYRRAQSLRDEGLIEETLRVDGDGYHSKEYGLCCEEYSASMEIDGSVRIGAFFEVTAQEEEPKKALHPSP